MKVTVWLVSRDRSALVTGLEVLALGVVILSGPVSSLGQFVGFVLLAHVGYKALTSLPMGSVPGRPEGAKRERRNQDLRSRVVGFLNEVRSVEAYVSRARVSGKSEREIAQEIQAARRRMIESAEEVAKVAGRPRTA